MIPRIGERVDLKRKYRIRPGAYAILAKRDQVLLTHQNGETPEFQLPGGGIDRHEAPIPALHREILEETGWRAGRLVRLGAFRRFTYMPEYDQWAEKICHIYFGRPTLCLGPPLETDHSAHWVSSKLAIELVANDGDRLFLKRLFG